MLVSILIIFFFFFFFNDTATTEIYTLSLHDALPISGFQVHHVLGANLRMDAGKIPGHVRADQAAGQGGPLGGHWRHVGRRSEEHTSELQSQSNLVCRLLLEKKKKST